MHDDTLPRDGQSILELAARSMFHLFSSISQGMFLVDRTGRTIAALNISGQANRTNAKVMQETMLPALREAAQTISGLLLRG